MKKAILFSFIVICSHICDAQEADSVVIKRASDEIFLHGEAYKNLEYLCKKVGPRLSGSLQAEKAVEFCYLLMKQYGFDTVYKQEVMVPHWIRGEAEEGKILAPQGKIPVNICALGGSIATPQSGITAAVIEVKSVDDLKVLGKEKIDGKIVFFNRPFDLAKITTFEMYGGAVDQRSRGAIEAARYGAAAVIVRSMTPAIDDKPHTGAMNYNDSIPKIPACAISTRDAEMLSSQLKKFPSLSFYLKMNCKTLPDIKSYNVIGEIKGTTFPGEIIAVGGHLDSWDLGEGAHDDGAGCMQSIEVLRVFKTLSLKPKRTIRAVMFMNEENGLMGGAEYAKQQAAPSNSPEGGEFNSLPSGGRGWAKHILAVESDAGAFTPRGFSMTMPGDKKAKILSWKNYFYPYGAYDFSREGGGADISYLQKAGVPVMGLLPDSQRYFDYHHAATDVFENVNKRELELGAINMSILIWLVSEYGL